MVGEVAAIEVKLDGQQTEILTGEPWSFACDFGAEPQPHKLEAIARNDAGHELDRATQWINIAYQSSVSTLTVIVVKTADAVKGRTGEGDCGRRGRLRARNDSCST